MAVARRSIKFNEDQPGDWKECVCMSMGEAML